MAWPPVSDADGLIVPPAFPSSCFFSLPSIPLDRVALTTMSSSPTPHVRTVWIVMGPAGCGKTTVASYISHHLGLPYLEGDQVQQLDLFQ